MTNTTTNPDFLRTISAKQRAWLAANGIEATPYTYGFFFHKGGRWIEPIPAVGDGRAHLMAPDHSEDGEGARLVEVYDRLRDALAALAAA